MHIRLKRVALSIVGALSLLSLALTMPSFARAASADAPSAAPAQTEELKQENSWRYKNGVPIKNPQSNRGSSDGANATALTNSEVTPLALNFRVRKEGTNYVADYGGGTMTVTDAHAFGVDVSQHNGAIDWQKAKADGVDFAILRLGWGSYGEVGAGNLPSTDYTFKDNYYGAHDAGVDVGIYLYSYAGWKGNQSLGFWKDYAAKEADHVLTVLREMGVGPNDLQYPIYYDLEEAYLQNETLTYNGEQVSNRAFLADIAKIFCDRVSAAGYEVGIYSGLNWWNNYLTDPVFDQWERWVARWPIAGAYGQNSQYQGTHALWQAHSEAWVDGIGTADINFDYRTDRRHLNPSGDPYFEQDFPAGSMFRLTNPYTGAHLFTTDANEGFDLTKQGWKSEQIAWTSPTSGTPVYRLYNSYSGDHHYTTSIDEYHQLEACGWKGENEAFMSGGELPIYRLFNPYLTEGTHLYTTSAEERDACKALGWIDENIAFYAVS